MILVIASIGVERIAPGTPHIQYQKTSERMTSTGLIVKPRASSIGVVVFLLVGLLSIDSLWGAFLPAGLYLLIHLVEGETVAIARSKNARAGSRKPRSDQDQEGSDHR